ncbi:sugar phosphate isomerase/epimerase [Flavobacterium sp.]|uniref:sugar phosphate isomerase/epimerase n=1 Tax=Flavobacterium sp. TaxID=239 RepID=UPI00333EBC99
MKIKFLCTYWGSENLTAKQFLDSVIQNGYEGVEINFPDEDSFIEEFLSELKIIRETRNPDFIFIAQQVLPNKAETVEEYCVRLQQRLEFLTKLKPNFINSHTGKDFFEFSENCKIIELTEQIARESGIPIWHEIHRGRFSFHLKTLHNYLDIFPKMKLIADFSHFCVVSESNLEDQKELLERVLPNIKHIHARVGFEQSPQVNNPFAPEWENHLNRYMNWWKRIIEIKSNQNAEYISITPEFGPFPYMPQEPFTLKPLSNQWEVNLEMKNYLQQNL